MDAGDILLVARGGVGDIRMKGAGILVVSLRGVNFEFWSYLGVFYLDKTALYLFRSRLRVRAKKYNYLLYRQECFTGKYTARKIHTKLHPGPEWRIFHILTSEYIDDVISRSFTVICANSRLKMASDRFVYIIKRKLHGGLKI